MLENKVNKEISNTLASDRCSVDQKAGRGTKEIQELSPVSNRLIMNDDTKVTIKEMANRANRVSRALMDCCTQREE